MLKTTWNELSLCSSIIKLYFKEHMLLKSLKKKKEIISGKIQETLYMQH